MNRFRTHKSLLGLLLAVVFSMLVLAPATDGYACSREDNAPGGTTLSVADSDGDHGDADETALSHGCEHGHCHAPTSLPPLFSDAGQPLVAQGRPHFGLHRPLVSAVSDSLIRPPRG